MNRILFISPVGRFDRIGIADMQLDSMAAGAHEMGQADQMGAELRAATKWDRKAKSTQKYLYWMN